MISKIKFSVIIIFLSFLFHSCHKDVKPMNELDSLVAEFDLKSMSASNAPNGLIFKNFNTIAEAKEYLNEVNSIFESKRRKTGKSEITKIKNIKSMSSFGTEATFSIFSPMSSCGPCGAGKVNAETDFGLISSMNIDFDYLSNGSGGYNINNVNTFITGLQFGLGWTQTGLIRNYSSSSYIMICIPGIVTAGISIGGVTFGWTTEHSYYVSFDPCGGGYDIIDQPEGC